MARQEVLDWLKTVKQASEEDVRRFKADPHFTHYPRPRNTYSRYVDEYSVVDHGTYIYFKGAGTAGGVCAGFSSGYEVPKDDILSKGATHLCSTTNRPYFDLTFRVASVLEMDSVEFTSSSEEFSALMTNIPSVKHGDHGPTMKDG